MKIDLDELERKATKPTRRAEYEYGMFRNEVAIALIARIRELECALWSTIERHYSVETITAILEKGAVLP